MAEVLVKLNVPKDWRRFKLPRALDARLQELLDRQDREGKLSAADLKAISTKSCDVLRELGPKVQWQQSYVTDNRIVCVYIAEDEGLVREHAKRGGFPANHVERVHRIIDPTTAE